MKLESQFEYFCWAYWNEMASEIYQNSSEALIDFMVEEGSASSKRLEAELNDLIQSGVFPERFDASRSQSVGDFWRRLPRVILLEEAKSMVRLLSSKG